MTFESKWNSIVKKEKPFCAVQYAYDVQPPLASSVLPFFASSSSCEIQSRNPFSIQRLSIRSKAKGSLFSSKKCMMKIKQGLLLCFGTWDPSLKETESALFLRALFFMWRPRGFDSCNGASSSWSSSIAANRVLRISPPFFLFCSWV